MSTAAAAASPLDLYEPLDIIGNGSFGIIRKVRRKSDGQVMARKELNFERMSERDRKQIVAEVNILKDLHHDNIVKYIDRFVDRDAGILYILMEYCDGGDLSSVIKQCSRSGRPLPEDTVWSYFFQLLMALQHCHCPGSKSGEGGVAEAGKRQQILHRDLKPENVFLSGGNMVKLGDFGLSKALGQTSFANTYVGTPYYMSPELIQEKSYDTKSDIWSLGCLIYELCALKPPFHEAQTHSELSMLIRNGRIPPLPKGYSHSLGQLIKAMLNLNPAMRPSAQQLLQHERIDFARKVTDTEKMLGTVKAHKSSLIAKERELQSLTAALAQREAAISTVVSQKDAEILRLATLVSQADVRIKEAVATREEELRVAVMLREEEVRTAMARREEEILEAVRRREEEINEAWQKREEELRKELHDAVQWVEIRQKELAEEADKLEKARINLAKKDEETQNTKGRKGKSPFDDVKNLLLPFSRLAHHEAQEYENTPRKPAISVTVAPSPSSLESSDGLETPILTNNPQPFPAIPGSAMRGVVLTATGETIQTPAPFGRTKAGPGADAGAALTKIIRESPRIGLNFRKIFDFEAESDSSTEAGDAEEDDDYETTTTTTTRLSSGSGSGSSTERKPVDLSSPTQNVGARSKPRDSMGTRRDSMGTRRDSLGARRLSAGITRSRSQATVTFSSNKAASTPAAGAGACAAKPPAVPTRLRRPSVRRRPSMPISASTPNLSSDTPAAPHPTRVRASAPNATRAAPPPPTPRYDPSDEENLPSPFLRRVERERGAPAKAPRTSAGGPPGARRKSNGNLLRAVAAANSANNVHSQAAVPPSAGAVKAS
ncbi:Pkinase-domain-containing protein [Phellopilus nigrolimitatus]|nr:Pkinase-domain-containing protein [Phellopilus nigrolimitatus]